MNENNLNQISQNNTPQNLQTNYTQQQNQMGQPVVQSTPVQPIEESKHNNKATISLILGIMGMVAWFIPLFGLPVTIIGLIFGIKGLKSLKRGVAIVGIVLSSIGLFASIVNASIGAYQGATGQNYFVSKYLHKSSGASKTEIINQIVKATKAQMSLPNKIDEQTSLVDITPESDAIRYHYVLSNFDTTNVTNDVLKGYLSSGLCQNKDTKNLLDQGINMEYSYSVENSTEKYFVSFTKTDCK